MYFQSTVKSGREPDRLHGRKEGRKDYICSSRLGLIRWYDRFRSDRRIQQVKAILDKVRYTNDILLPHKLLHGASAIHKQSSILVPHTLQSRTLKDHGSFLAMLVVNLNSYLAPGQSFSPAPSIVKNAARTLERPYSYQILLNSNRASAPWFSNWERRGPDSPV